MASRQATSKGNTSIAHATGLKDFENLVKLYSGSKDAKLFRVHRDFVTQYSPVLKAAFESDFLEGQTQEYHFGDDVDDVLLQILSNWFYTSKVDFEGISDTDDPTEMFKTKMRLLVRLWVLADKLLISKLQNAVITKLDEDCEEAGDLPICECKYVFDNTAQGSPLRAWFVFEHSFDFETRRYREYKEHFPHEMLLEMVILRSSCGSNDEELEGKDMKNYLVAED